MNTLWDKPLDIDFNNVKPKLFNNIEFKSLDENTSFVCARLLNNEIPIDLNGYVAMVRFNPSYGDTVTDYATITNFENGEIRIHFQNQVLCEGDNNFEIYLVKNGSVKLSSTIWYRVFESIIEQGDISQETNYPILINLIKDINNSINRADAYSNTLADKLIEINKSTQDATNAATSANKSKEDADNAVIRVNQAIASGTQDLEVKQARISQDGTVYTCLNDRLKAIENSPYVYFVDVEG